MSGNNDSSNNESDAEEGDEEAEEPYGRGAGGGSDTRGQPQLNAQYEDAGDDCVPPRARGS